MKYTVNYNEEDNKEEINKVINNIKMGVFGAVKKNI